MSPADGKEPDFMHAHQASADSIQWLVDRGFDRVQAHRLAFVRWSVIEACKAQFCEFITSDAPVIETLLEEPVSAAQSSAGM
jgi:hypothetical protein